MISRILICLVLASASSIAFAQEATSATDDRLADWLERFPAADADKDGVLTRAEAIQHRESLKAGRPSNRSLRRRSVQPSHADVAYGPHERNVFDLYLPEKPRNPSEPLPVFVFFHGGGFVGGDKSGFDAAPYLQRGFAVVSGNYRLVDGSTTLSPIPLNDAARVIQFLRHKSDQWNLDTERIAVSGSSAGAVITMWIGFHDDLADVGSPDPVARQSTRVRCIVPINGPTNLDPKWITKNMGGPKHIHGSFPKMFGAAVADSDRPEVRARILESSPYEHATSDDPPSLLIYSGRNDGIPLPESASTGKLIHHAYFGAQMAAKLKSLGVEHEYMQGIDPRKNGSQAILDWLDKQMGDR
jgi:acetyl esterase/lipase